MLALVTRQFPASKGQDRGCALIRAGEQVEVLDDEAGRLEFVRLLDGTRLVAEARLFEQCTTLLVADVERGEVVVDGLDAELAPEDLP